MRILKNKKRIIIVALYLLMALTIVGLLFVGFNKNEAKADEYTPDFVIEDGISIKLNEDGGMRFIAKMDTTLGQALIDGEKTMQFIIAPTAIFDYADENNIEFINLPKKIVVDVDKNKVYPDNADEPTCYYANGCVTKMNEANFNLTYEAVGYIVGERYTERNSNATGTYYEKVNATFLNQNFEQQILGLERYDSWYGTDKYPIVVENSMQYDRLVAKCNAGNTAFNEKYIICENEVIWDSNDFTNEAAKPEKSNACTITYTDAEGNVYETFKVAEGAKAPKPAISPSKASDEGYKYNFSAWSYNDAAWNFAEQTVNEDVTLTPAFAGKAIEYTIAYDTMDGVTNTNPTTYTIETPTFEFAKASKDGYYFDGWYTDNGLGTKFSGIETGTTGNKYVYANFIDTSILSNEISNWAGDNIGGALNASDVVDKFGSYNIYKTNGGYGQSIVNTSIDASNYTQLHFAFKASARVNLNSGDYNTNVIEPNMWSFVKLEKQTDGNWIVSVKAFGGSEYTTLEGSFASGATFDSMFKTYLWLDGNTANNHEVYATDVWGLSIVDGEVAAWEEAGAKKLGSALNSSEVLDETFDRLTVYKTNGGYGQSIVNKNIDASHYLALYFAFKATQQVNLSNGNYDKNVITPNVWYFVQLEKQADGSWTISVKKVGDSNYTAFTADAQFFGAGNATFETMFRTYLWTSDTYNHEVYATDVWGVSVIDSEIALWEATGAEKLGSALNSSDALTEKLGELAVYKTNGGFGQSIVNKSIDASVYSKLYFAFKTDKQVTLSNGSSNVITPNTWYFVQLEKQADGSWTISAKAFGDSAYTALVASSEFFSSNATFETMFRTYLWIADAMQNNHEVYATDVWGVEVKLYLAVEDLIDALPDTITSDKVSAVFAAYDAYQALSAEQQAKVNADKLTKLNSSLDQVFALETSTWAGANKVLDNALNDTATKAETFGNYDIYSMTGLGTGGNGIGSGNIQINDYKEVYFMLKVTYPVSIFSGDWYAPKLAVNTWYAIKLVKGAEHWSIYQREICADAWTELELDNYDSLKSTEPVWFSSAFVAVTWDASVSYDVFASGMWCVEDNAYKSVEALIDELPDSITNADIDAVFTALNAYQALSATQQAKVDATKVAKLNNSYEQVIGLEFNTWEAEGLKNTGLNALSSGTSAGTWGNLAINSVVNSGYDTIANTNIDSKGFTKLYFAYKTDKSVNLSNGMSNTNNANTWYFVKLEKQVDGNWTISAKAFRDSEYTVLEASTDFFGAGTATFATMFKTYSWDGVAYNVYATNVWGVSIVDGEIAAWEAAGAQKLGSALNSSDALTEKLGALAVYKTNGGYGQSIVNKSIDASNYTQLHFAFKTNQQVTLSNGDYQTNVITPNTWYFVKLEKQVDGSWTLATKKVGGSDYTALVANVDNFGAGKATFETMFRTYLWTADTYNHEVYATDVWGVSVVDSEIAALEAAGAEKLGSALNSSEALDEKLGSLAVYKTNGGYGQSIANTSIDVSTYSELYFAYKTDKSVNLSSGTVNTLTANTWRFVKLERQEGGSWAISVKEVGASEYTVLEASTEFFGSDATFETMFRTYLWIADAMENNHQVYATEVWGVECNTSNAIWDGNIYKCSFCNEILGTVTENIAKTQEIVLYTNATYAGKGASGNAFDASAARSVEIDLSEVTDLEISGVTNIKFNGVAYTVSGLDANKVTINGVIPYEVFGEYTLTAQITVKGATFDIQMPILVITDLITDAEGLLNVRKVLRGQDTPIVYDTANPVEYLVVGGTGGLGTMNGRGYYKLGNNIDLENYGIASINPSTAESYNRVYVFGTTAVPFAGTFDGAGYVLDNFIAKPNFWNYNVATGFTYLFQDPQGATGSSHAQEIEASLFGMVDGTIKNLAITNAVFGQNGNVVNGGNGGTLENVYVQIKDMQADAYVFVAPIAQHSSGNNMTLRNVVIDLTKHSSAILNGTSSTAISTRYPSVFGLGAVNIENVGVYGFNTAWIDTTAGRGNVYTGNADGSEMGIYTAGLTMTNSNASFWQISLDPTIWKIVDGVPMLINISADGTFTEQDDWTGEEGDSYNIAWSDEVAGAYEAVTKIRDVTTQVTTQVLGVTAEDDANIIVGTYDKYAEEAGVDVSTLATDGRENYGVYNNGLKIYVLADGEEGFRFAADMLLRQLYGYNELSNGSFTWTDSTIWLEGVENEMAQVAFSKREPANGYNIGDMKFNATQTYTTYGHMHNTLDYLYATDGNGNVTGSAIVPVTGKNDANQDVTYTTTSYWLASNCNDVRDADNIAGEQLCYLAHGDKTAFNALVDHVVNRILEVAKARPTMTAINFMIEDDPEYCMCATCKPFYNSSIPQLLFLNTVAEKLANNEYLKNSCRTIDIVFFAYASYAYAPITSTAVATSALANTKSVLGLSDTATETISFNYAAMNKAGATYTAAKDTTSRSVLKAHKNLRLQWTSHKAFHSYALTHEANSASYLGLMAWLASVDVSKTEVFMYQTTFSDYFLPLNTWKYQVEWYKNLNDMGINGYIFNLGNMGNPADAQTGFAAFKAYIDSRAMTDSSVTYEQLKDEFFGINGYYGTAGPTMRTFFEELETVMEGKKQTSNYVDCDSFSHFDYDATNYPYYHYYTDGTSKQAVRTTYTDRVQAWFNGAFDLSQAWILFGNLTDEDLKVATSVGKNENPSPIHAALTFAPQTDVYQYDGKTQLETLKAWYQYCVTAKGMVAADSVYAKRIQVESWFPEYALRLFHSTYTINFNLLKGDYSFTGGTYNYSAMCTGVTSILSADTGLSRSATEFYNELMAGGMIKPSEQSTFNTTEKLSLGWVRAFYRNDGKTSFRSANCVCEISASPFVNWGVF